MPIKYIGRTTDFKGKSLWEILGNLKNFGVGRIVVRSMFERYPEPSYMKIIKVETQPATDSLIDNPRKVRVWVERTFRGETRPKPVEIFNQSYKPDFRLLMKHEEEAYCKYSGTVKPEVILPQAIECPPLLKLLILNDKKAKGENITDVVIPTKIAKGRENHARIAKDGETPTVKLTCGLGTPVSPSLYEGINL